MLMLLVHFVDGIMVSLSFLRNIRSGPAMFGLHLPWMLLMVLGMILVGPYAPVCLAEYSGKNLMNCIGSQMVKKWNSMTQDRL